MGALVAFICEGAVDMASALLFSAMPDVGCSTLILFAGLTLASLVYFPWATALRLACSPNNVVSEVVEEVYGDGCCCCASRYARSNNG